MTESEEFKLAKLIQETALEAKRLEHEKVIAEHSNRERDLLNQINALKKHQGQTQGVVKQLISQLKRTKHCVLTVDWRNEIESLIAEASQLV